MIRLVFASCWMVSVAAPPDDLLSHKNWHLLGQLGNCGRSPAPETAVREQATDQGIPYRIFKGTATKEHEFPWMAQLLVKWNQGHSCSAVDVWRHFDQRPLRADCIIKPKTSEKWPASSLLVRLGAHRLVNDCSRDECRDIKQVDVEDIIMHKHFKIEPVIIHDDQVAKHDIALIHLTADVTFESGKISPVCLPANSEMRQRKFYGQVMVAAGFGQNNTGEVPEVLQKISTTVRYKTECDMPLGWEGPETQICVGGISDRGICRGDSGGPLMYRDELKKVYYQMGIASYFFNDCNNNVHPFNQDFIFMRVAFYMPWILDHVRE